MRFSTKLKSGTLVKRYKRFLADIIDENGNNLTIYCPNTGTMLGCSTPGSKVFYSKSANQKRKYPHTLEIIQDNNIMVGVNTGMTNHLVAEAIENNIIKELQNIDHIKKEIKTSDNTRLDLLLKKGDKKIYIEIKNCTLVENHIAMFPDAVTTRGTKHLLELARLASEGHEAIIFYCVQRNDALSFKPAAHIDPAYAKTYYQVLKKGVKMLAYQADVTEEEIKITKAITPSTKK